MGEMRDNNYEILWIWDSIRGLNNVTKYATCKDVVTDKSALSFSDPSLPDGMIDRQTDELTICQI